MEKYKKKVLIFDNDLAQLKTFLSINIKLSHISYASDLKGSIQLYKENFFNLIIINTSSPDAAIFLSFLKKISKNKPIILISDSLTNKEQLNSLNSYSIDGHLFIPFLKKDFYFLLDNIFEKQEEQDQLFLYLKEVELIKTEINNIQFNIKKIDQKVVYSPLIENYDSDEIISSVDFFDFFDDTIIDKVEELHSFINDFSATVFSIEQNRENPYLLLEYFHKLSFVVKKISSSLFYFQHFKIIGKAFLEFSEILESVSISEYFILNKDNIIKFMISLDKDLESWFYNVFIDRTASNILYFDSSFISNIYLFKNLIFNEEVSDNTIEFF